MDILSSCLEAVTYKGAEIQIPEGDNLNIYMGIGLWSRKDGRSHGLPIDIMQMLIPAKILSAMIDQHNPERTSKVIILIADSMAVTEGAEPSEVEKVTELYKKALAPLIAVLRLNAEIVLSSEVEKNDLHKTITEKIKEKDELKEIKWSLGGHYNYILGETSITEYMHTQENVGVKIGWIAEKSAQQYERAIDRRLSASGLDIWDELKFDRWHREICRSNDLQYLYTRSGLKQSINGRNISISEAPPYIAHDENSRYLVGSLVPINEVCPVQKAHTAKWKGVAEVCAKLVELGIVHETILPCDCIRRNNDKATVSNMLQHWMNITTA